MKNKIFCNIYLLRALVHVHDHVFMIVLLSFILFFLSILAFGLIQYCLKLCPDFLTLNPLLTK